MVKFEHGGIALEGRIVKASYRANFNMTLCVVDTGTETYWVTSKGELSEGNWDPEDVVRLED